MGAKRTRRDVIENVLFIEAFARADENEAEGAVRAEALHCPGRNAEKTRRLVLGDEGLHLNTFSTARPMTRAISSARRIEGRRVPPMIRDTVASDTPRR